MKKLVFALTLMVAIVVVAAAHADTLWDNGPIVNDVGGYSNGNENVFEGARRSILDDFVVPVGQTWAISSFEWLHVWGSGGPDTGTGIFLEFYHDNGGRPDLNLPASGQI